MRWDFLSFCGGVKNGGNIGAEGDDAKAGNREVGEWRCERLRGFGEIWEWTGVLAPKPGLGFSAGRTSGFTTGWSIWNHYDHNKPMQDGNEGGAPRQNKDCGLVKMSPMLIPPPINESQ